MRITKITVSAATPININVSDWKNLPDQGLDGEQITTPSPGVIYKRRDDGDQTGQIPAVWINEDDKNLPELTIEIHEIPSTSAGKTLRVIGSNSPNFVITSTPVTLSSTFDGGSVTFQATTSGLTNSQVVPRCFLGQMNFYLESAASDNTAQMEKTGDTDTVPLELYVLGYALPSYFSASSGGLPLLLLRMFVGAASATGITTQEDWVVLVVNICHGSAEPFTGILKNTEEHWLKYDTTHGALNFISGETGGTFYLSAWLNSYRNWKADPVKPLTMVNCYDQAAAVELALCLGIDFNTIAWEFHQKYGFIGREARLVGWGFCNNPYFKQVVANKIVDENSATREYFRNHAFLSWTKETPLSADLFTSPPADSATITRYALDACAGPHVGVERTGDWIDPATYPAGYGDKSTYWQCRDPKYNTTQFNTTKELLNYTGSWYCDKNQWGPGITGLSTSTANISLINFSTQAAPNIVWSHYDPTATQPPVTWTDALNPSNVLATFTGYETPSQPTEVFSGKIASLQAQFRENVATYCSGGGEHPTNVPIQNIIQLDGGIRTEMKLYKPGLNPLDYHSLRITVYPSKAAAFTALQASALAVAHVSPLSESGQYGSATMLWTICADYCVLWRYANLVFELGVSGKLGLDTGTVVTGVTQYYLLVGDLGHNLSTTTAWDMCLQ